MVGQSGYNFMTQFCSGILLPLMNWAVASLFSTDLLYSFQTLIAKFIDTILGNEPSSRFGGFGQMLTEMLEHVDPTQQIAG